MTFTNKIPMDDKPKIYNTKYKKKKYKQNKK